MTFRRVRFFVVAVVLSTLFLVSGAGQPASTSAAPKAAVSPAAADWTFWGCWSYFPSGGCRDIYRDAQGNYWICRACGTTGNPGPGKCSQISPATLATGYWCS
jgi:hypothetical protein